MREYSRKVGGWGMSRWTWGYDAVHAALRKQLGNATTLICLCGERANDWALSPETPLAELIVDVHTKSKGKVFSHFFRNYKAKCHKCNIADGHPQLEGWTQRLLELGRTSIPLKSHEEKS